MNTWARTGPIAVEVDGTAEDFRVVDYACMEALRSGAELILIAAYHAHAAYSPMQPGAQPKSPAELADRSLRSAVSHIRHRYGYGLQLNAVSQEGSRLKVLPHVARTARMLIVGRNPGRSSHRIEAHRDVQLAARSGCPVVVVPQTWAPSAADRRVAVGLDGTPLSAEALEFAFRMAADREGDVTVVHCARSSRSDDDGAWISRSDYLLSEALDKWTAEFPGVRVTRFISERDAVSALVHESETAGLVVVGSHAGSLPIGDPVARRSVAAMTCPVAVVPHQVTVAERAKSVLQPTSYGEIVAPTY